MDRFLNRNIGIVWSIEKDHLVIDLPSGGKIDAPKTKGIRSGDTVALIMDTLNKRVKRVILKSDADKAVKRGSNHIYDVACRDVLQNEEEHDYGGIHGTDEDVLWCPELCSD